MGIGVKTICAAGVAFAAGVATTVTVLTLNGNKVSAPTEARPVAAPQADRKWSDPIKSTVASVVEVQKSSESSTLDRRDAIPPIGVEPRKSDAADTGRDGRMHREQPKVAQIAEAKRTFGQSEQVLASRARADQTKVEPARVTLVRADPIRMERHRTEAPRLERPRSVALSDTAVDAPRLGSLRDKPPQALVFRPVQPRAAAAVRLAAKPASGSGESLAADRDVRSVVTPVRGMRYAEAQQRDVREPRRRMSSADTGGVMKWLMEPGANF